MISMCPFYDFECENAHLFESLEKEVVDYLKCPECGALANRIHTKAPSWSWSDKVLDHKINTYNKRNPNSKRDKDGKII